MCKTNPRRETLKQIAAGKISLRSLIPKLIVISGKGEKSKKPEISPEILEELKKAEGHQQLPYVIGTEKDGKIVPFAYRSRPTKKRVNQ